MLRSKDDSPQDGEVSPSEIFLGVRFVLLGFDPIEQAKVGSKLVGGGGVDVGQYGPRCTHLIVDKIAYDDSVCVVARADGKTVVTALWVEHCIDVGMLVDVTSLSYPIVGVPLTSRGRHACRLFVPCLASYAAGLPGQKNFVVKILYRPVKDLNGIPGASSMSMCLTGYQRHDRDDIMIMVAMMGARFSKPLVANKVTHLICYKFEGEKYELAKKLRKIKLVNHRWLEDCLREWEILPESNYSKSGYELEIMEAEAKDSEEETEENKNNKLPVVNVANGNVGSGARIPEESKEPILTNLNVGAKNVFSSPTKDNVKKKRLASIPTAAASDNVSALRPLHREGKDFTSSGTQPYGGGDVCKESCELLSNPITTKCDPILDAAPDFVGYSRKSPARSPVSKFSEVLSTHVHKSPHGGIGQYKDKVGVEASPPKLDLDLENVQSVTNKSKLSLEGDKCHSLPQKRKVSLSNARVSEREVGANSRACEPGSSSASAITEGLLNNTTQMQLNSHHDNSFYKNDTLNSARNRSDNPEMKSLSTNTRHSMLSDITDVPSDFKMLERTPKTSDLGLESSFLADGKFSDEITGIMDMVEREADTRNELRKSRSPVDLAIEDGSTSKMYPRSSPMQSVAKSSFDSKSKLSTGSYRQKGSLCLGKTPINATISKDEDKEAEHGKSFGDKLEMFRSAFKEENVVKDKATGSTVRKEVENAAAASADDETEAPEEDNVAELENATRDDMFKLTFPESSAIENKLELAEKFPVQTKKDTASIDNPTVTLKNDVPEVSEEENSKNDEANESILKEKMVKGRSNALSKSKKNAVSALKKRQQPGKDMAVELESEYIVAKKTKLLQDPENKLESGPIPLGRTDEAIPATKDDTNKVVENRNPAKGRKNLSTRSKRNSESVLVESETIGKDKVEEVENPANGVNMMAKKAKVFRPPANKLEPELAPLDKTEEVVSAEKDNSLVENGNPVKGRKYVSARSKRNPESVFVESEITRKEKAAELQKETEDRTTELEKEKEEHNTPVKNQNPKGRKRASTRSKRNSESEIVEKDEKLGLEKEKEAQNTPIQNQNSKGRKYASKRSKTNPESVLVESEITEKKKVAEFQKVTKDETVGLEKEKEVPTTPRVSTRSKRNTESVPVEPQKEIKIEKASASVLKTEKKKALKKMEAEKENKPIETGNADKQKRETVATRLIRLFNSSASDCSKARRPEPAWFILSGHRLQRKEFQQVIKRLKGKVCRDSHNWNYQATHFIVPDPIKRTEKFFAAAASGRWILKTDYLTASNEAGKFLAEEDYEWYGSGFNEDGGINLEAPRKWRLLRERTGHGAFHGMRIVIYGDCIAPTLDTLKRAAKAGDGVILATSPPYTRFLKTGVDYAIVSPGIHHVDSWVQEFIRHEIPCVAADYLVEFVSKPGSSLDRHVLYNTHTWAERSNARLVTRLEEVVIEDDDESESWGVACQVCGGVDRGEVMLICGDEKGEQGCGIGMHIDCCDPKLDEVPDEDWFCPSCSSKKSGSTKKSKKASSVSKRR